MIKKFRKVYAGWQIRYFRILEGKLIVHSKKKRFKRFEKTNPFQTHIKLRIKRQNKIKI